MTDLTKSEGMASGEFKTAADKMNDATAAMVLAHMGAMQRMRPSQADGVGDGNHLYSGKPMQSSMHLITGRFSQETKAQLGLK